MSTWILYLSRGHSFCFWGESILFKRMILSIDSGEDEQNLENCFSLQLNRKATKDYISVLKEQQNFVSWFLLTSVVSSPPAGRQSFACKKINSSFRAPSPKCFPPKRGKDKVDFQVTLERLMGFHFGNSVSIWPVVSEKALGKEYSDTSESHNGLVWTPCCYMLTQ